MPLSNSEQNLLDVAANYFQAIIAPQATKLDGDPQALKIALEGMGDRALLALRVPLCWGGGGVNEATFRHFQMMIARYSGALAFLQTQHQTAGYQLANCDNETLKQSYLPRMGRGEVLVGVGFSQLRRKGEPLMKGRRVEGGYVLSGFVPWITGYNFFDDFIIGATLPDGQALYGVVPLQNVTQGEGKIVLSQPMELMAASAANTVSAELTEWFLEGDRLVCVVDGGVIHSNDRKNAVNDGFFALGCSQAALDIIESTYDQKGLDFIKNAFDCLSLEVNQCREKMFKSVAGSGTDYQERLKLRAYAINLAQRCASAAVTVSSGAANSVNHAAGRIYREALLFSVVGQTSAIMEATLERLLFSPSYVYNG